MATRNGHGKGKWQSDAALKRYRLRRTAANRRATIARARNRR